MKQGDLIAKAFQPVYCRCDAIVALTVARIHFREATWPEKYMALPAGRIVTASPENWCKISCKLCGCDDVMWYDNDCYLIRTDKRKRHGP